MRNTPARNPDSPGTRATCHLGKRLPDRNQFVWQIEVARPANHRLAADKPADALVWKRTHRRWSDHPATTPACRRPDDLEEVRRCRSLRARLRYKRTGLLISVVIARCCPTDKGKIRWLLEPHRLERDRVAVVALLDEKNTTVKRLSIHPNLRIPMKSLRFGEGMGFLEAGLPLEQPSDLMRVIRQLRGSRIEV